MHELLNLVARKCKKTNENACMHDKFQMGIRGVDLISAKPHVKKARSQPLDGVPVGKAMANVMAKARAKPLGQRVGQPFGQPLGQLFGQPFGQHKD